MNRRTLLARLGGGLLAIAGARTLVTASEPHPDDFQYRGWRVMWRGWIDPPNQVVRIGAWVAYKDRIHRVSTTMGGYDPTNYRDFDAFDTSHRKGWPTALESVLMSNADSEALKQRACRALLEHL